MVRTQIQLTDEQAQAVKRLAASKGVSMAEIIRQGLDRILTERSDSKTRKQALEIAGRFRSGFKDVSREHDAHLAEDYR